MTQVNEEKCCRYCFEDESVAKLISPCDCRGSAAYIHKRCALKWMLVSEHTVCELCNVKFRCKPSKWAAFKKSLRGSKHEALCYAIVFAVFMAPVILFKSVADALRYNSVLTYEQADRLLTGGLFGTYLLLIVFGVLIVAVWVHKCHDDPIADAAVAPEVPLDTRPAGGYVTGSGVDVPDAEGMTLTSNAPAASESTATAAAAAASDGLVAVVMGDPRSPGETRRALALAAARSSSHNATSGQDATSSTASSTRPNSPSTASLFDLTSVAPTRPNTPTFTVGASPSVSLTAIVFHHKRERRNDVNANASNSLDERNHVVCSAQNPEASVIELEASQVSASKSSASSQSTPSRFAAPIQSPDPTGFSHEVNIERDDVIDVEPDTHWRANQIAILGMF